MDFFIMSHPFLGTHIRLETSIVITHHYGKTDNSQWLGIYKADLLRIESLAMYHENGTVENGTARENGWWYCPMSPIKIQSNPMT